MADRQSGDENARLNAVNACLVLDTPREQGFDSIVFTAAQLFRVPMAMLTIVTDSRVWLKSFVGPLEQEYPRQLAPCSMVVDNNAILIIEDIQVNSQFTDRQIFSSSSDVRFYAGIPVHGPGNQPIGALSVLDRNPRTVPDRARTQLIQLAHEAEELLKRRTAMTI